MTRCTRRCCAWCSSPPRPALRMRMPVSVCGEMAGNPRLTRAMLLGLGLRSFSMNAAAVPRVKQVVRGVDIDAYAFGAAGHGTGGLGGHCRNGDGVRGAISRIALSRSAGGVDPPRRGDAAAHHGPSERGPFECGPFSPVHYRPEVEPAGCPFRVDPLRPSQIPAGHSGAAGRCAWRFPSAEDLPVPGDCPGTAVFPRRLGRLLAALPHSVGEMAQLSNRCGGMASPQIGATSLASANNASMSACSLSSGGVRTGALPGRTTRWCPRSLTGFGRLGRCDLGRNCLSVLTVSVLFGRRGAIRRLRDDCQTAGSGRHRQLPAWDRSARVEFALDRPAPDRPAPDRRDRRTDAPQRTKPAATVCRQPTQTISIAPDSTFRFTKPADSSRPVGRRESDAASPRSS